MNRHPALERTFRWLLRIPAWFVLAQPAFASQSPLLAHSEEASRTATLAWVLFSGGLLVFIAVGVLLVVAVRGARRRPAWMTTRGLLVGGGIAFPAIVLGLLLVYTEVVTPRFGGELTVAPLRVSVTGQMWWWRVRYHGANGEPILVTANELHVPIGRPVEIVLDSTDVIHSFWVPGLSGMQDMIPGRLNRLRFVADTAGTLRGQCTEYCGLQHAKMSLDVRVHAPEEFDRWLAAQLAPGRAADTAALVRGQSLFVDQCGACHAVRGSAAAGTAGPDLTHVGSRMSLAAGALPNNAGTMAAWIVSNQHLKPGNRMPEFDRLSGADLTALANYVVSLQ